MAELLEAAAVEVGELVIVQAEQAQERDVEIANGMNDLRGGVANLVSGPDDVALFHAAAGEENGHGVFVMITTKPFAAAALAVVRRATEFAAPDDERIVEHTALLEIL